ncbi:MAG: glutamine--tRNA ligase/YqeY domain fusion protein [Spirochaetota bacterium]|nr:glutamine--tRNA ligase/YqeY domain fusion protein [Spirochaetota bacterium]
MDCNKDGSGETQDFIRKAVRDDLEGGRFRSVHTRFPPEPNGYLHIGHAKAICIDFGMAREFGGLCNLRFDDTNPVKEDVEFADAIMHDIRWLGFDWGDRLYYASDYFEKLCEYALQLIDAGHAYVCDLTADEIRDYRGTLTRPGRPSPYRERSREENLALFKRMAAGEFPDGSRTLRAKIDMASPNINMRDPVIFRILHAEHHRTGDRWKIYPTYDFAHGQSDSLEGITHSLCSLEFEIHRPLYDWFCETLGIHHPRQIEFARLNLSYTVMSKRKLRTLVEEGYVTGWDDPRMPTLCGLRRRGYTPRAIRDFCERIGVNKMDSTVDIALLEHCLREDLNTRAQRRMVVLDPVRLVLDNWPAGKVEMVEAENNPEDANAGRRHIPFSGELFIEREDVMENPPPKYHRLAPGREVRLKHGYYVTCTGIEKDTSGRITLVHAHYDPASRGGWSDDGRKVLGTLHWVSAAEAVDIEVRIYDRLFRVEKPELKTEGADEAPAREEISAQDIAAGREYLGCLNADSLRVLSVCRAEPALADAQPGEFFQFLRQGYFVPDTASQPGKMVFNLSVRLKDSWKKV